MTPSEREEIEKVARECVSHNMECVLLSQHDRHEGLDQLRYNIEKAIIAQVAKARAEERERCAKIAENFWHDSWDFVGNKEYWRPRICNIIAESIRNKLNQKGEQNGKSN